MNSRSIEIKVVDTGMEWNVATIYSQFTNNYWTYGELHCKWDTMMDNRLVNSWYSKCP